MSYDEHLHASVCEHYRSWDTCAHDDYPCDAENLLLHAHETVSDETLTADYIRFELESQLASILNSSKAQVCEECAQECSEMLDYVRGLK